MAEALRNLIADPNAAERELIARYAMLGEDPRRERAFAAFAATGLPHRRLEAWKWTDFKAALPALESQGRGAAEDPFASLGPAQITVNASRIALGSDLPAGLTLHQPTAPEAFGAAEHMPLGALTAALSGQTGGPAGLVIEVTEKVKAPVRIVFASDAAEASFARVSVLVRPGAAIDLIESHLGGAGLSSSLLDLTVQEGAHATRTLYQAGRVEEAQAITADVSLEAGARFEQTVLAFGAKVSRLETRLTHCGPRSEAHLDAAYLAGPGHHIDLTSHVRHGAQSCITRQVTKGAVLDGGRGVFQGKFFVPAKVGQHSDAEMQHHALLLENGAEVFAKPELEIYADDVECAHGNTCGAMDAGQLFYLRQRGIPEAEARALLTEAFIAEALEQAGEPAGGILLDAARSWLGRT